ncbi:MAG: MBL fold metallo-hydrolase, partial [Bacillati bacterium ANGP1]
MTPPGGFTATRKIGDAAVTIISEGSMSWAPKFVAPEAEWRRAVPEVGADGAITIGLNLAHIRIGNASILIDPGLDDPDSAWQRRFAARWPGVRRSPGLERALEALGVRAGEVTHVLITHAHGDHFGGVTVEREGRDAARFPRARHLIGRADWAR